MPQITVDFGNTPKEIELADLVKGDFIQTAPNPVAFLCPHCATMGTFERGQGGAMKYANPTKSSNYSAYIWQGVRFCPNLDCRSPVFIMEQGGDLILTYPPETIDFDTTNLPPKVENSLQEAIECYAAGCYRGAALLARRTLEEICLDRGAKGSDLKKRIENLGSLITVPKTLIEAMHDIRLLGNDAAHVEAKTYDDLGAAEIEITIALCKELVKATYQYEDLLGKIKAFQKSKTP